ncbi:MAG: type II toxin-antitoxin system RelB/DinJ family antitoxin [Lachnospirales bacterium]
MAKTSNLYVRIEPEVKEEAESILNTLGIPASNAINVFYKQIILQKGLPFEVRIPQHPFDISKMIKEQLDFELQKGLEDVESGRIYLATEIFGEMRKDFNI